MTQGVGASELLERGVAWLRLTALPTFVGAQLLSDTEARPSFPWAVAVGGLWSVAMLAAAYRRKGSSLMRLPIAGVDLLLLAEIVWSTGGAESPARFALFAFPVIAAPLFSPRPTALIGVVCAAMFSIIVAAEPTASSGADAGAELLLCLWMGLLATVLSATLNLRRRHVTYLERERRHHLAQALSAEQRERSRLAELLHDEALQQLLGAHQDAAELREELGDDPRSRRLETELGDTIDELRRVMIELHPRALEATGLEAALRAVGEGRLRRAGTRLHLSVCPGAEGHGPLLFALGRELLTNVAKHARAREVTVTVRSVDDAVELIVADDGAGCEPRDRARALREGHVGLVSAAERAAAAGGELRLSSTPGEGTIVGVHLPSPVRRKHVRPGPGSPPSPRGSPHACAAGTAPAAAAPVKPTSRSRRSRP